ncbi:MAG: helix-turn-helix transcriptional regulator [Acidobacteria bacterium]|nr:helix-turn-helix transcriptional regulator [Acidobacteriota bacterium]
MSMSSVSSQFLESFRASKAYRHAFVEEKVRTSIAAQIKAIREQRGYDSQMKLATEMGKTPSWICRLENPNQSPPTISTLLELAEAFDVDLTVEFTPFSALLRKLDNLSRDTFLVPGFEEEFQEAEQTTAPISKPMKSVSMQSTIPPMPPDVPAASNVVQLADYYKQETIPYSAGAAINEEAYGAAK